MQIHQVLKTSKTADETEAIGQRIGARLRGGEVIELVSDLGGGKTTLTRGIVAGTGSQGRVASPTFTLTKQYDVPAKPDNSLRSILHADLYRLQDAGLMTHELQDVIGDPQTTLIIEWADVAAGVLPDDRLTITLTATTETDREIKIEHPPALAYLVDKESEGGIQ